MAKEKQIVEMEAEKMTIELRVNGNPVRVQTTPENNLLNLLRNELGLTGTKRGCEIGECGACTVLLNGKAVNSCLVLAPQVDGCEILTVEGLLTNGKLHPLQQSFIEHDAVHCGFCTPGLLMSAYALLQENPTPGEKEIKQAIAGNLCRCTGYHPIIAAIKNAHRYSGKRRLKK